MPSSTVPGINAPATTDLPVLKPYRGRPAGQPDDILFSRWLVSLPVWVWIAFPLVLIAWPSVAFAATDYTFNQAMAALFKWLPFIVGSGFVFNVLISFFAMLIGTLVGVVLGLMQISRRRK